MNAGVYYEIFLLVFCGVLALIAFNSKEDKKSSKH